MGLVNAAGFPAPGKPVKKSKKSKPVAEAVAEKPVEPIAEECCALGCNDCEFKQEEAQS